MAERRLGLTGAERVVPQGRGEIGEAVAGVVSFQRQGAAVTSGAALGHQ